ncbi:hypothetical protein FisN_4Lh016 [Fistulifera solaris]|uniref:Protein kinase domain-containing protein n=1 Tax=Fistulifera solaris TaxID=1519565 RepID=A0A1Z5KDV0_FISSO|nr:hypothetical protein FisN_4Lh016 [Fistulifera solaris]|eukprot:GAX24281.1 hypothetical protein FisN_4Lh016 [Fistulifera solaris]
MPRIENPEAFRSARREDVAKKAEAVVASEIARSSSLDPNGLAMIPSFSTSELTFGRVVGRGGFCVVHELVAIKLKEKANNKKSNFRLRGFASHNAMEGSKSLDTTTREHLARRVWSKSGKYVTKRMEPSLWETDRVSSLKGVIDLALEMHFLASLNHVHIIDLKGICEASPFSEVGFFLVLDHLKETLSKRLTQWMHVKRTTKGITGLITGSKTKTKKLLIDQLLVAHDIANGMQYLHSKKIIFRDLKPDNVGFHQDDDTVKIFDFGLAKELQDSERDENGLYRMTGVTGALRYMAPEVGLRQPYNLSADVYSWSMIMWYIMALEPPFGAYLPNMFFERVFQKGYRPAMKDKWSDPLKTLMKESWSSDVSERPSFEAIQKTLRDVAKSLDPGIANFLAADTASSNGKNSLKLNNSSHH